MALGIPGAFFLLLDVCSERASEYDIQMLKVYEERLRLAGFGNYSDGKTSSETEGSVSALGKVAQNFLKELNAKLSSAVDKKEAGRIIEEYNQHLVLAGFGSHYNTDYFTTWVQNPPQVFRDMLSKVAEKMSSNELREQQKLLERHRASTIRVGFLAAANLLFELEMGFASDDDLLLLGDYEKRLLADMERKKKRSRASRRLRMREWPPPTLGIITNNFLQDLAEEVDNITDIETRTIRLDEFDEKLRLAGYSDHYDDVKIQALKEEFEKDFRIASGELSLEEAEALYSSDVASSDTRDEASNNVPSEASNKVKDDGNLLSTGLSKARDESEVANENSSPETEVSPSWKLIILDTPPPPVRPHVLCGSEQDPEDPRVTKEVTLQEIQQEQTTRDKAEERQTDAAASLVTDEGTNDESDDDASVVTGADIIEEAGENIHPDEPRGIDKNLKKTPSHIIYQDTQRLLNILYGVNEDVNKMANENSPFHPDQTFSKTDIERIIYRSDQNPSDVPVANTSKTAYEKPHDTLPKGVLKSHGLTSKDPKIEYEATQHLREVAVDPSPTQKPHQISSGVTVARETIESATKLTNVVKKSEPSPPPVRSQRQTRPRDPSVTYAIKHSVPVEDRYKVVAHRRLPAPVDWFNSDRPPTPEFKHDYARLYTHLPLVIRTVGFSERQNQINAQLADAPCHIAALLRKQYDDVVAAFEKNLADIRADRAAKGTQRRGSQQPNQEEWRRELILWLVTKRGRYPPGFSFRPLNFSDPLTCRASAIAERMKCIDTRLANGNTQQALILLKEFDKVVASIYWRLDAPIPGEVPLNDTRKPLPPDLDDLRRRKNRASKDYNDCPCPQHRQILKELSREFRRRIAIFRANQLI